MVGSSVFDGARYVDGVAPDLKAHCDRVNHSAEAMMITPTVSSEEMVDIIMDGIKKYKSNQAIYIRPMYWAIEGGDLAIVPKLDISSSLDIPMPLSEIFKVFAFGSTFIFILRSIVEANDLSVRLLYLLLSQASDAFEINSRKKMSLLLYNELITIFKTLPVSASKSCFSALITHPNLNELM